MKLFFINCSVFSVWQSVMRYIKFTNFVKSIYLVSICLFSTTAFGEPLSPNGYSGLGVVPSASTVSVGKSVITFDTSIPGAPVTKGFNTQVGLGLTENLELVGRLATNDQKCNLFINGECPANTFRDFSSSLKWKLPIEWLTQHKVSVVLGATDFGGAATYFRSTYVVGSKKFDQFEVSIGQASAKVPTSMLNGTMAAVGWRPTEWGNFSLQKVGVNSTVHALIETPALTNGVKGWVTFNQRLSQAQTMEKNWLGLGVEIPLDGTGPHKSKNNTNALVSTKSELIEKKFIKIKPAEILSTLQEKGFYNARMGIKKDGVLTFELENSSYLWNTLDAVGVAVGVIAGAYAEDETDREFELYIKSRGIRQLKVSGGTKCIGMWLSSGVVCHNLSIQSQLQNSFNSKTTYVKDFAAWLINADEVIWEAGDEWKLRPEVIISPAIVSAIGTEYGAYDFDMGASINLVLPLWTGATIETNRLEPLGIGTRQFEQGGVFFGSRLQPVTNRRMIHQLVNLPNINTQARVSVGTTYATWSGQQLETSTQSSNGRHKIGYTGGTFKDDKQSFSNERNYRLLSYRYVNDDQQRAVTEFTQGKFWAGDKGFSINQRFWYGDTALNVYLRRSRMGESQPLVSFAGFQIAIPFTPRENKNLAQIGFRGTSQWTYSLETKVMEKDNIITGGYGEVPRVGESLITTFNRDRNSSRYFDTNLNRVREAYLDLANK